MPNREKSAPDPSGTHRWSCPNCGKHFTYQINQLGMQIKCSRCQEKLRVGIGAADAAAPASSGMQRRWFIAAAAVCLPLAGFAGWRLLRK